MAAEDSSGYLRKRRILKNTAANGVAQVATMISTFIFLPLLIRAFGFSAFGVYTLYLAVNSYAAVLDLGVGATLTRMVAERAALDDYEGIRRAILSAAVIYSGLGVLFGLTMFALGWTTHTLFNLSGVEADLLRLLLWVGGAFQLWYWPTIAARDALAGLQRYDLLARVTLGLAISDIVATVFVLVSGQGPLVLVGIRMIAMVVASLIHIGMLRRVVAVGAGRIVPSRADVKHILRSGSSLFVVQITGLLGRQHTDKLILGVFFGTAAVTIYEIGAKLNTLISSFSGLTVSATLPVAAELNAHGKHASLLSLFLRGTKIVAGAITPLIVILIAMAGPFISAWMGPGYDEAVVISQVLLLSQIFIPLYLLGDQILIGKNRFSLIVPLGVTLAVLNVVLSVVFALQLGIIGVAVGTLISYLLELPWYLRVFGKEMALGRRRWLSSTAWPTYPLLAIPAAIAYLGSTSPLGTSLGGLMLVGFTAVLIYWVVLLRWGYPAWERASMLTFMRSLVQKSRDS